MSIFLGVHRKVCMDLITYLHCNIAVMAEENSHGTQQHESGEKEWNAEGHLPFNNVEDVHENVASRLESPDNSGHDMPGESIQLHVYALFIV